MQNRVAALVVMVVTGAAASAGAHSFPATAKSFKASLVQNYPPCTAPDATTAGGKQACLGPAEVDPSCLFGSKGIGTLSATITKQSIKLHGSLRGLDPGCNGKVLNGALTVRITSDDCATDHCTVVDQELTGGNCTVSSKGACAFTATIASGYPAGAGSEMTIVDCGIKNGPLQTFTCGIMVK